VKYAIAGIVVLWVLLTVGLLRSCNQLGDALNKCHPGLVTTEKSGQKSTTIDCTTGKFDGR
jgi:hypothetical protein